jgi:hypothetical protein
MILRPAAGRKKTTTNPKKEKRSIACAVAEEVEYNTIFVSNAISTQTTTPADSLTILDCRQICKFLQLQKLQGFIFSS